MVRYTFAEARIILRAVKKYPVHHDFTKTEVRDAKAAVERERVRRQKSFKRALKVLSGGGSRPRRSRKAAPFEVYIPGFGSRSRK